MSRHKSRNSVRGMFGGVGNELGAADVDRVLHEAEQERQRGSKQHHPSSKRTHNGSPYRRHEQPPPRLKIEDPDKPFVERPIQFVHAPLATAHKKVAVPSTPVAPKTPSEVYFDYFLKFRNQNLKAVHAERKNEIIATVQNMLAYQRDARSLAFIAGTVCSKIFNVSGDEEFADLALSSFRHAYNNGYRTDKFITFYIRYLEQRGLPGEADNVRSCYKPAHTAEKKEFELP